MGTIRTMAGAEFLELEYARAVKALNAGLFVSRGQGIHPDRRIDSYELILVKRGTLHLAEEAQSFAIGAGETLLLWPQRRHWGTQPYGRELSFYWIHFRLPDPLKSRSKPENAWRIPQVSTPARLERLTELMHRFLDDQTSNSGAPGSADLLVTMMLCEVAAAKPAGVPHAAANLAGRADSYLARHFRDAELSTSVVADALDCNPDYLGRIYKQVYGRTLTDNLHRRRIQDAGALLREGGSSVEAVAEECGFSNAGYFRRIFRRLTGLTPRAYRRLYARMHINSR